MKPKDPASVGAVLMADHAVPSLDGMARSILWLISMRMIIPHTAITRTAAALLAAACVLSLLEAATARDDLGLHRFWAEQAPVASTYDQAAVPRLPLRSVKAVRPLRIALVQRRDRHVARHRQNGSMLAQATPARLLILPIPKKPAIVSLYEDRTLRNGDAVMLADGIHVFRGDIAGPHRPRDFIRLQLVASLGWKLRETLSDLDRNPPTRWTSLTSTPS